MSWWEQAERTPVALLDLLVSLRVEHLDVEVEGAGICPDEGAQAVQSRKHMIHGPRNPIHCDDVIENHVVAVSVVELALSGPHVLLELCVDDEQRQLLAARVSPLRPRTFVVSVSKMASYMQR
eukprot:9473458-Pyramimonas_sp.AAC.5